MSGSDKRLLKINSTLYICDERSYLIHEVDFLLLQLQSDTSRLVESVPDDATLAAVHLTALDLSEIVRPEQQPASTPEAR